MRRLILLALVALTVPAACKTAPEAVPDKKTAADAPAPAAAEPPTPPLALTELTAPTQSLLEATLHLEGKLAPGVGGRNLEWTAKIGDQTVGQGTATLEPGQDGVFTAELPVTFGEGTADLAKYENSDTQDISVAVKLGDKLSADRAVSVRSPRLPLTKVLTVQAQKTGPETIGATFLVSIKNPNLFDVQLTGFNYKATIDGKTIGSGSQPGGVVPAAAESQFEVPLEANPDNCGKDIRAIMKRPSLNWGFEGTMQFGAVEVPFTLTGDLKLSD